MSEYELARTGAVCFDASARTKLELRGADRARFLHGFCTNDIVNLAAGQSCEAFVTNRHGKILARIFVYALPDSLWIDADSGLAEKLLTHLRKYAITEDVEFHDRTGEYRQWIVAGPKAAAVMEAGVWTPQSGEWRERGGVARVRVDLAEGQLRRTDALGLPGFEVLLPRGAGVPLPSPLLSVPLAGPETYHILRIEAGIPEYGRDIDESNLPQELGRTAQAISWTKGCYLGQEPICRIRDLGHVNQTLLGLRIGWDRSAPPAGARLVRDGSEVGKVTSSAFSPRLGAIALAYVRRGHQQPGTRVQVATAGGLLDAEVTSLPFPAEELPR